jgi:hypothetical protein
MAGWNPSVKAGNTGLPSTPLIYLDGADYRRCRIHQLFDERVINLWAIAAFS